MHSWHKADQDHVKDSSSSHGDQHILTPHIEKSNGDEGENLRDAECTADKAHVLETVDDQHAEDCGSENFAQVFDSGWNFFSL